MILSINDIKEAEKQIMYTSNSSSILYGEWSGLQVFLLHTFWRAPDALASEAFAVVSDSTYLI